MECLTLDICDLMLSLMICASLMNFASDLQYAAVDLTFGHCGLLHVPQLIVA